MTTLVVSERTSRWHVGVVLIGVLVATAAGATAAWGVLSALAAIGAAALVAGLLAVGRDRPAVTIVGLVAAASAGALAAVASLPVAAAAFATTTAVVLWVSLRGRIAASPIQSALVGGALTTVALASAFIATNRWGSALVVTALFCWWVFSLHAPAPAAGLVVLTLLLPVYNAGWLASIAPSLGLLTILLGLLAVAFLVTGRTDLSFLRDRHVLLLASFAGVVVASLVLAPRGAESVSAAKTLLARGFLLPLLMIAIVWKLDDAWRWWVVWKLRTVVVAVALVGAVLSLLQVGLEVGYPSFVGLPVEQFVGKRAVGFAEHPGTWAAFLMIPLGICGARWLRLGRAADAAATAATAFAIVLTGLRMGWIVVVLMTALGVVVVRNRRSLVAAASLIAVAAVALSLENFRTQVGGGAAGGPIEISEGRLGFDESAAQRLVLTRAEVELGLRHALTGVGLGNVGPAFVTLDRSLFDGDSGIVPGAPIDRHNAYAGLFAELGVPGLLTFLGIVLGAGISLVRSRRRATTEAARNLCDGLAAALLGTAVLGLTTDADRLVFVWWLVGMAFALAIVLRRPAAGVRPAAR